MLSFLPSSEVPKSATFSPGARYPHRLSRAITVDAQGETAFAQLSQLSLKAYAFNSRRAKNRLPSGVCWTILQSGATPLLRTEARRLMFLDTSLDGGTWVSIRLVSSVSG